MAQQRDFWSSSVGFTLATIGAAIGLGSIWKFPYEVGANGGGAFLFFYILGLILIVFPLMLAEFVIGRRGRGDAATAIATVASHAGASRYWALVGVVGVAASFIILSFYSVIAGWAISYVVETPFVGVTGQNAPEAQARFDRLLAAPVKMVGYHAAYMGSVAFIVARGISRGIEDACKFLMPILMGLIIVLSLFSIIQGDVRAALQFLLQVNSDHFTVQAALDALGLGFFSIGVGMSVMITYAAHAASAMDLRKVAIITICGDTAISFAAGLAIFPIVFAEGLDPASGSGLLFVTLPLAFAKVPGGLFAALGFFFLLVVAGIASGISMLEMPVAALMRRGWQRSQATAASALACWICGLATVFSFNVWSSWHPLAAIPMFAEASAFELLDHLTSNLMLPLAGLALALFVGWTLPSSLLSEEIGVSVYPAMLLRLLLRYLIPISILIVGLFPLLGLRS